MAKIGGRRTLRAKFHNSRRRRVHQRNLAHHNRTYRTGEEYMKVLRPTKKYK